MISYRDFSQALKALDIQAHSRVLLHARIEPFGEVAGGEDSLLGAVVNLCEIVLAPAFTPQTMVIPAIGPQDNALDYGDPDGSNREAEIFSRDLAVDPELGAVNQALSTHPRAKRSSHPILSFSGINAEDALATQNPDDPWAPVEYLASFDGDVLMMGCDHHANVALHLAERMAGRKTFIRWALTSSGVVECRNMPGCTAGFERVRGRLGAITRSTTLRAVVIEAIPLRDLLNLAVGWLREDPRALLCDRTGCPHCASIRAEVRVA